MTVLKVNIFSPAKVVAKVSATEVMVPGALGYLTILPGHARLVSELGVGELKVGGIDGGNGGVETYFVAGGYVDVSQDDVTLLVDVIERPGEIDKNRAEQARQRALDRLDHKAGVDVQRAQAALLRAEKRLLLYGGK